MNLLQNLLTYIRLTVLLCLIGLPYTAVLAEKQHAEMLTLHGLLENTLNEHVRIRTAQAEVDAETRRIEVALGGWFPDLDLTVNSGNQQNNRIKTQDYFASANIKLTQLLWDFGATNTAIEKSRLKLLSAEIELQKIKQKFVLDAASAYINLLRAHQALEFTKQSEANIRNQTGMEEAKVAKGAGYSTDVLQAKTQLAAAIARRLRNEEALIVASNSFQEFFGFIPTDVSQLKPVTLKSSTELPENLATLIELANTNNLDIRSEQIKFALAKKDVATEKSTRLFPKINLSVEEMLQQNARGTQWIGESDDLVAKVEVRMPFNLGFVAYDSIRAAEMDASSKQNSLYDTQIIVERKNRSAFQKLKTARLTAESLQEQADIAEAFLELARVERQLGNRSLIDILTGEVSLINAKSDTISAQYDAMLAILSLLEVIGALQPDIFNETIPNSKP